MHWTEQDSRGFAEYAAFFVPEREAQARVICASLAGLHGLVHVLEPGCGDGYLARATAQQLPSAVSEQIAAAYRAFVDDAWNLFEHLDEDPIDQPSTLAEQLAWLRAARFNGVEVYWMKAGHAIFGGCR